MFILSPLVFDASGLFLVASTGLVPWCESAYSTEHTVKFQHYLVPVPIYFFHLPRHSAHGTVRAGNAGRSTRENVERHIFLYVLSREKK